MSRRAGIAIASLFEALDQLNQALPGRFSDFINRFVAIDLESRVSDDAIIHSGVMQSLDVVIANNDVASFDLGFAKLRFPGVTTGVPFRFAKRRSQTTGDLEPGAESWQFDLFLTDLSLEFDKLIGAQPIKEAGTTPRHLVPLPGNPPVSFTGTAIFRIERTSPEADLSYRFVDAVSGPDPFLPDARSGAIAQITCTPPHFLTDKSGFGFTIREIMFDGSEESSPQFVIERGQSASWTGFALREATVYTPAAAMGLRGLSFTIRDFLIGNPAGLQGEIEVQFGRSPLASNTFVFEQIGVTTPPTFGFDQGTVEIKARPGEEVDLKISLTVSAPPADDPDGITDYKAKFKFPRDPEITGDSATGSVKHGDEIEITPIEVIGTGADARELAKPAFKVRAVASGTAPQVNLLLGTTTLENVVELSGAMELMDGLLLGATSPGSLPSTEFQWSCEALQIEATGNELRLAIPPSARGEHHIELREKDADDKQPTRIRISLREPDGGKLLVGSEDGIFDVDTPTLAIPISTVHGIYDLLKFHTDGKLIGGNLTATRASGVVTVPAGAIALVTIDEGGSSPVFAEDRHLRLLFAFSGDKVHAWETEDFEPYPNSPPAPNPAGSRGFHGRTYQPFEGTGTEFGEDLLRWAANYSSDTQFFIIGRCDDVGSDAYNQGLGERRAAEIRKLLTTAKGGFGAIPESRITIVQEQSGSLNTASANNDPDATPGRLINTKEDRTGWPVDGNNNGLRSNPPDNSREAVRERYRRADVYAVGGTASDKARFELVPGEDPTQRKVLVPAVGRDVAPADNENAKADFRVKLLAGWDRARFTGAGDLVPNLAEIEYAWTPANDGISLTNEVLMLYGKWIYDDLTGFTEFTVGLDSQGGDGLARTEQSNYVAAFSLGPMLLSGVDADAGVFGSTARLAALGLVSGFADFPLGGGAKLIGPGSHTVLRGLESKSQTRTIEDPFESFKTQFTVTYSNELHINTGALGLKTKEPMKLRYDNVGLEFDNTDPSRPLPEKIGVVFESDSMTVEDSGLWEITGPLQRLLRVTAFRMGVGSFWIEPTLAVAIDIGVVEISEASFRVTFETNADGSVNLPPSFSLRGFSAAIDIPSTLKGEGRLKIEDGGVIKAGIDVTVLPLKMRASAALAIGRPPEVAPSLFLNLYARVQFPGGIPLGPIPLAIHGFIGQTVINGSRDVADTTDIVTREIGWWRKVPEEKYKPERGQHALGLGVVLGTLPDASFSLSVTGMVVVAFPDPEVILGVEVELLSIPDKTAKDKKDGSTATITGLVVINDEAVSMAISAAYEIPKILELKVPFAAYFPYPGGGRDVYVRLGSDNVNGRTGEPITITFLPSTLNIKAWSYLMIEGGGIISLGGEDGWDFEGFAIGFGAGIGIEWKAGPIGLSASARMLVGMGTSPLVIKGGLFVDGKLDLVVVSISARGDIVLTFMDPPDSDALLRLEGKFCGEVDLFFFSIKGCVDFSVGDEIGIEPPAPPAPVQSISLTDRLGAVMGEATTGTPRGEALFDFVEVNDTVENQGVPPEDNHTVWPDTVPVLNFGHWIEDAMGDMAQFARAQQPSGEPWFGSSRLKYAYRLDNVILRKRGGANVADPDAPQLQSAWTHSPSRAANDTSGTGSAVPSGAEVAHLQLLNWEPWAWARSTQDGGEETPGDPARIIERTCDPVPPPSRACLFGSSALVTSLTTARLVRDGPVPGPYPSKFRGESETFIEVSDADVTGPALATLVASLGLQLRAGGIVPVPAVQAGGRTHTSGYLLPAARDVTPERVLPVALPWRANLDREVTNGELTLLVCQHDVKGEGPEGPCYMFERVKPGQRTNLLDLPPFQLAAKDPGKPLETTDRIDASRRLDPRIGSDGTTDVIVNHPGATLTLKRPCHEYEIYYYRPGSGEVIFTVHHADGSKTEVAQDAPPSVPMLTTLTSDSGIVSIEIDLEAKQIILYRLCCNKPGDAKPPVLRNCINLGALPQEIDGKRTFEFDGATFTALDDAGTLRRSDAVNSQVEPARFGQDGSAELLLPNSGVLIELPAGCTQLEVSVMLGAGPVTIRGLNSQGEKVAEQTTPQSNAVGITLTLTSSDPITAIEITGGSGEAFVYRICCVGNTLPTPPDKTCVDFSNLPKDLAERDRAVFMGFEILPARGQPVVLSDKVVVEEGVKPGSDGRLELGVNPGGLVLRLPHQCSKIELHIMQFGRGNVTVQGLDAQSNRVGSVQSEQKPGEPQVLILEGDVPMSAIFIEDFDGGAVLYRLCCLDPVKKSGRTCIDFKGQRRREPVAKLEQQRIVFADLEGKKSISVVDAVNVEGRSIVRGRDDRMELAFSKAGLGIALPLPVQSVELLLALPQRTAYRIVALNRNGEEIDGQAGRSGRTSAVVRLRGKSIEQVRITAKTGGILAQLCVDAGKSRGDSQPRIAGERLRRGSVRSLNAQVVSIPVVTSEDVDGSGQASTWQGSVVQTFKLKDGLTCSVVRYRMPDGADPFDRVSVTPSALAQDITLLSLCGVDERAAKWAANDREVSEDLVDSILNDPNADGRPVLLDPDSEYEIVVDWSWQAWQGESDTDNAPATPPDGEFQPGTSQTFRFRTASEDASLPALQDGANEFIFDPRDVDRYLVSSDPENAAIAHFTDDPVVFHFSQAHIGNLLDRYGRELAIEVRRTDPPPQPGAVLGPVTAPLPGLLEFLPIPFVLLSDFEQRLAEAAADKPCIPGVERIGGGTSLVGTYPLLPRVMYDADLFAQSTSDPADKVRIQAGRFMTSRYANPTEMIEALGMDVGGTTAPVPMPELIVDAEKEMPTDVIEASDRDFDQAMTDLGLETLELPEGETRAFQIWRMNAAGTGLETVGFLIDALEPLDRTAAVVKDGAVEIVTRCKLAFASVDGREFSVVRRNRNSTRVLLKAPPGFVAPVDPGSFELHFETSDGTRIGRRQIRTIPLVVELEGF